MLIWRTFCSRQRADLPMKLTVTRSGLKAETKQQGITEYWSHRITYCLAPPTLPRVFCWVYKHEGKRMKPELRYRFFFSLRVPNSPYFTKRNKILGMKIFHFLDLEFLEYRREKLCRQNARLNAQAVGQTFTGPKRKLLLQTGSLNFRPPVSRSKSAPRLFSIDEEDEDPEDQQTEYSDVDSLEYRESPIGDDACSTNSIASSTTPVTHFSRQNSDTGLSGFKKIFNLFLRC
ncbi:unnamed protein product [Gongylonema pulchrum]|uniref:PID domain-containing protein n=1 Tax=Gongylonema pulchrum TaxID=637853 RepID=A0A3P6PF11_9BILA|nr:unnamed protein product [Gongylonema pulchrum]